MLTMTCLDAVLLQQKKSFFTGGFLTGTQASTLGEAAAFLSVSLVVDASVAGVLAAVILLAFSRIHLTRRARLFLVAAGAATPLIIWDFVNYSLLTHLGDAFDLGLMLDLAGSVSEIFAVASSHLVVPAALTVSATLFLAGGVAALNRYSQSARTRARFSRGLFVAAGGLFVAGLLLFGVTTAASDVIEDGLRRKASGQVFTTITARLTDFDRDGYGIGGRTSDPAPFNGAVFPYALDVPSNGIDEDAVAGDLPSAQPAYVEQGAPARAWRDRPDLVLFVLESFRADAVGRTVDGRSVTPTIDALAKQGASSSHAFSHNGYTTQSRFHLLTGSLAGLREDGSLIDDFKAQGYETAYFSAQDESFGGPELDVGFERADVHYDARQDRDRRYSTFTTAGSLAVSHAVLRERIEQFVRRRDGRKPLFLYVNFHDTHFPYHHREIQSIVSKGILSPSQIAPARADALRNMYYNTAANVDRALGATLDLVTRATGREPAVIVTADHGESLFDEDFLGHGYALNDAQTRIPLVVRGLPLEIVEPFGQSDLRGAIGDALSRDAIEGMKPRVSSDPGKTVFQYLGTIQRPRQLGFASARGRLVYDFRDRRVLYEDGTSRHPDDLSPEAAAPWLRLVHFWERMMLARASHLQPQSLTLK